MDLRLVKHLEEQCLEIQEIPAHSTSLAGDKVLTEKNRCITGAFLVMPGHIYIRFVEFTL